jgi:hypothetical protein
MLDRSQLNSLSFEQIVDQFGLVHSQYKFEATVLASGKLFVSGTADEHTQSVFVDFDVT